MGDLLLAVLRLMTEAIGDDQTLQSKISDLVKLFKDAEQSVSRDHCVVCRLANTDQGDCSLEQHHIAGESSFPHTITVCNGCHTYLSDHQKSWLILWQDSSLRVSSFFFGWAIIFDLLHMKTWLLGYERLATMFRAQGYYIRNSALHRILKFGLTGKEIKSASYDPMICRFYRGLCLCCDRYLCRLRKL